MGSGTWGMARPRRGRRAVELVDRGSERSTGSLPPLAGRRVAHSIRALRHMTSFPSLLGCHASSSPVPIARRSVVSENGTRVSASARKISRSSSPLRVFELPPSTPDLELEAGRALYLPSRTASSTSISRSSSRTRVSSRAAHQAARSSAFARSRRSPAAGSAMTSSQLATVAIASRRA